MKHSLRHCIASSLPVPSCANPMIQPTWILTGQWGVPIPLPFCFILLLLEAKHNLFHLVFTFFSQKNMMKILHVFASNFSLQYEAKKLKEEILLCFASNLFSFHYVLLPVFLFLFSLPCLFKGTVAQDFYLCFFFMNRPNMGSWFTSLCLMCYNSLNLYTTLQYIFTTIQFTYTILKDTYTLQLFNICMHTTLQSTKTTFQYI
jgi:hypothetical protein